MYVQTDSFWPSIRSKYTTLSEAFFHIINQSIHESTNQLVNPSNDPDVNRSINQSIYQPLCDAFDQLCTSNQWNDTQICAVSNILASVAAFTIQSLDQPTNQPINQSLYQSSINQKEYKAQLHVSGFPSIVQRNNHLINLLTIQSVNAPPFASNTLSIDQCRSIKQLIDEHLFVNHTLQRSIQSIKPTIKILINQSDKQTINPSMFESLDNAVEEHPIDQSNNQSNEQTENQSELLSQCLQELDQSYNEMVKLID